MKKMILLFAISFAFVLANAKTKPPSIADALQAKFWKAQAMMQADANAANAAQQKLNQSRIQFQSAIQAIQQVCGKEYHPQMNPQGDLECVATPKPAKK